MGRPVDLVLGGGGVRGVAHVGALSVLADEGYEVQRVAGASSGAIAGAMVAAGATHVEMRDALVELDWRSITMADIVGRLTGAPLIGDLVDRLTTGRFTDPLTWIEGHLQDKGVHTWADLRLEDPPNWLLPNERYKLVVRCLDIVNHRVVRLPWDYGRYGLDPDTQSVADAVRASMSVPFVFDPVPIGDRDNGGGLLIDGGLGTSFSVDTLDRRDGEPPDYPTFGLRLSERPADPEWPTTERAMFRAMFRTMIDTGNDLLPVGPCDEARTVTMQTTGVRSLDVRITHDEEDTLFEVGATAMREFLATYDHETYRLRCRQGGRSDPA